MNISAASTTPKPTVVARMVIDDMPGMGVDHLVKRDEVVVRTPIRSTDQALAIAREHSGVDRDAIGVFRTGDSFELFHLGAVSARFPSFSRPLEDVDGNSYVARTHAGRGLVEIVDGIETADLMTAAQFRPYERWATPHR